MILSRCDKVKEFNISQSRKLQHQIFLVWHFKNYVLKNYQGLVFFGKHYIYDIKIKKTINLEIFLLLSTFVAFLLSTERCFISYVMGRRRISIQIYINFYF